MLETGNGILKLEYFLAEDILAESLTKTTHRKGIGRKRGGKTPKKTAPSRIIFKERSDQILDGFQKPQVGRMSSKAKRF
jgi:hypothetical protein